MLEAIAWALYGMPAARGTRESIRSYRAGAARAGESRARLRARRSSLPRLARADQRRAVSRRRRRSPIATSISGVTDLLRRRLGMSHDEFFNTYFTGQKELERHGGDGAVRARAVPVARARLRAAADGAGARARAPQRDRSPRPTGLRAGDAGSGRRAARARRGERARDGERSAGSARGASAAIARAARARRGDSAVGGDPARARRDAGARRRRCASSKSERERRSSATATASIASWPRSATAREELDATHDRARAVRGASRPSLAELDRAANEEGAAAHADRDGARVGGRAGSRFASVARRSKRRRRSRPRRRTSSQGRARELEQAQA